MDDDFNTALALAHTFDMARSMNRLSELPPKRSPGGLFEALEEAADAMVERCGRVLGILEAEPNEYFTSRRELQAAALGIDADEVEALIKERAEARGRKDFGEADRIRDKLAGMGVLLEDGKEGTRWRSGD